MIAILSKYCSNPNKQHCKYVQKVFIYLNIILNCNLTFIAKEFKNLIDYSDSDFADAVNDHKLTEMFVFILAEDSISHQAKQQSIIVLSFYKTEYITLYKIDKKTI